jgi:branched-chain amino acid transport system substrate-binding protein
VSATTPIAFAAKGPAKKTPAKSVPSKPSTTKPSSARTATTKKVSPPTLAGSAAEGSPATLPLSKEPIRLGVAVAQTGIAAPIGQDQTLGAKIAEQWINDNGGINGHPLTLVVRDTGSDDLGAVGAITNLVKREDVVGIVGPTLSQQAFAADPIAEVGKTPVIGSSNTAAKIPQIGSFIARVSPEVSAYTNASIRFANSLQPTTRAALFFAEDDPYSRSESAAFQSALKRESIEILPAQGFKMAETDFSSQLAFLRQNSAELLVISGGPNAALFVRKVREAGFRTAIVGGAGLNVLPAFSNCRDLCDGLIFAQAYSPEIPVDGVNAEFRKRFKADQKREPNQVAAQEFAAIQVFAESLRSLDRAGKLKGSLADVRVALNAELLSGTYQTPLGELSFDAEGEVKQKSVYAVQLRMLRGDSPEQFSGKYVYTRVDNQ